MDTPKKSYAILSSHRSGSSVLCNVLSQTNIAGKPGEYFGEWEGSPYRTLNMDDYTDYVQHVITNSQTRNGVFGVKVMDRDFLQFCDRLETFPIFKGRSHAEKVRAIFPNIKFIYLTRRNKLEQAISWWKVAQNNHYHTTDDAKMPDTELVYNFDAISHLLSELIMEDCAHQEFLRHLDAIPLTIVYEDFIQDMQGTVQHILDFVEIADEYDYHEPRIYKMADELTQEWAQRYRKKLQAEWLNIRW